VAPKTLKITILALLLFGLASGLLALENIRISDTTALKLDLVFRGYILNDQRIYWSGLETSFGAEAAVRGTIEKKFRGGMLDVESEFFLNQPFGRNILTDEYREDYMANWQIETFQISKLNIGIRLGKWTIRVGKALPPFGRCYFNFYSNNLNFGAPFIRTEAILWRETGLLVQYRNGLFSFDIAAVNGEENRDTNSSKAGIVRLGLGRENWGVGFSYKEQDGIGSEQQKEYKGHTGFDFMFRVSKFTVSGEWIWDRYGFHREFDEEDIYWPRSLYFRDIFYQYKTPIKGKGGYLNLLYESSRVAVNVNYGEYYPQEIGNPLHDPPIKRLVGKIAVSLLENFRIYFTGILENQREEESWSSGAKPYAMLLGIEYQL
jgi:hypothetical protein